MTIRPIVFAACLLAALPAAAQAPPPVTSVPLVRAAPAGTRHKPAHTGKPVAKSKPVLQHGAKTGVKPVVAAPAAAAAAGATVAAATAAPAKVDPAKGTTTGLKLPRWVALRSDEVNLRTGPGRQYPIDWQYHRRDLPVRVLREFEVWRLIETQDGGKGWVHQATLTGRRGFVVVEPERVLRAAADEAAAPVARLQPGVVGHIRACEAASAWCEVQTGDFRGFLKRGDVWGLDADEAVN